MQWQIYLYNILHTGIFISKQSTSQPLIFKETICITTFKHCCLEHWILSCNVDWLTKEDKSVLLVGSQWLTNIMTLLTDFWWSKMLISHWWAYHKTHSMGNCVGIWRYREWSVKPLFQRKPLAYNEYSWHHLPTLLSGRIYWILLL